MGIEPTTYSLGSCRSTTELRPRNHVQGFKLERPFISASHEFSNSTAAGRSVFMMSPRQCSTKMIHKTPKRLCRRLHDAPALAQRREQSIDLAVISEGKRERKALKARAFGAMSVGEQKRRIANLQPRMHHVFGDGGIWRRAIGIGLEAHPHDKLRAQCFFVEGDRLVGASFEEEIGLDLHVISFLLRFGA